MSLEYNAEIVFGVPIHGDQREQLLDRFGYEADRYMWQYDYEGSDCVFGIRIVNGIEDRLVEIPDKTVVPWKEQAMVIAMLETVMDKVPEWRTYLLFHSF